MCLAHPGELGLAPALCDPAGIYGIDQECQTHFSSGGPDQ